MLATDTTLAPATAHSQGAQNHPALAATHWWADCSKAPYGAERAADLAPIAAAHNRGGAPAVIKAASGSNHCDIRRAWALAMTAVHGPVGTHETQGEHPEVIRAKARAADELRSFLAV